MWQPWPSLSACTQSLHPGPRHAPDRPATCRGPSCLTAPRRPRAPRHGESLPCVAPLRGKDPRRDRDGGDPCCSDAQLKLYVSPSVCINADLVSAESTSQGTDHRGWPQAATVPGRGGAAVACGLRAAARPVRPPAPLRRVGPPGGCGPSRTALDAPPKICRWKSDAKMLFSYRLCIINQTRVFARLRRTQTFPS